MYKHNRIRNCKFWKNRTYYFTQMRKIMNSTSLSKTKIAILAAFIYTAFMGCGMFYMKTFKGIFYGTPDMMNVFWLVLIIVNIINVFFVIRYFSWQEVGFRKLNTRQLLWFIPSLSVLIAMWVVFLSALASASLDATQWQLLALVGFTTFLVGLGEETMYRGIVLNAFLTTSQVRWAMLVSAIAFSLLHSVNVFGGLPLLEMLVQLVFTFLFGFLFAPLMIKFNNIWPLIIFHWLWDFVLFAADVVDASNVSVLSYINTPVAIVVGTILWIRIHKEQHGVVKPS